MGTSSVIKLPRSLS